MSKFKKKPVIVEAVQLTKHVPIEALEDRLFCHPGDWLITSAEGEQYCCRKEVFELTHEAVEE